MFAFVIIACAIAALANAQDGCTTPDNRRGACINIMSCEPMRSIVNSRPTPQQADYLRRSLCGYEGRVPKVCCPVEQPTQPPAGGAAEGPVCYTPESLQGSCIDVKNCASVVRLLQRKPIPQQTLEYVRQLRCNGPAAYSVCCASDAGPPAPQPTPAPPGTCQPTASLPQSGGGCCGLESTGGNRIIGGNETNIDQYPWMALIEYRRADRRTRTLCGGALISARFVLTAGHCVLGDVLKSGTPVSVRLGEYDTSTAKDCVPADGGGEDCTDPVVTVPIERTLAHPQYDPNAALKRNDIALLMLRNLAPYTDFIRPICLPTTDVTKSSTDIKFWAAGWGATNSSTSSSNKKLHIDLPFKTFAECQHQYSMPRRKIQLWSKQLCAGGVKDRDSCKGDSGGPLMLERGSTFEVVGVVSFGTTPCGMANVPGVYTKVFEYLEWIRSVVK